MKILVFLILISTPILILSQQNADDEDLVYNSCMNYIEGFYEGDTVKLIKAFKPEMYKIGYYKNKETGKFDYQGQMTFQDAKAYARKVKENNREVASSAPKEVLVLDVAEHIASAKVTAWWGIDYILLSKTNGNWKIEQVLWQGPLSK